MATQKSAPRPIDIQPAKVGWEVRREGSSRASSTHATKAEAVLAGRGKARDERGSLRIKGRDGKIQEERTYHTDPFPPAG